MWNTIKERLNSPDAFVSMILGLAAVLVVGVVIVNMLTAGKRLGQTNIPGEATGSANITLPTTHTVSEGDTLWSIAEMYYKSGYNWVTIRDANKMENPDSIIAGQKLAIPVATTIEVGQISSTSTERVSPKQEKYSVVAGDSLWAISVTQYGSGYVWPKIAATNMLANPNLIYPGTTLTLPIVDIP